MRSYIEQALKSIHRNKQAMPKAMSRLSVCVGALKKAGSIL
jgi:hypothetical protein